jgi:uncharacterized membrane protein YcfT
MQDDLATNNRSRVDWVDYAKGICIVWVVTMYATDYIKEITHSIGWMQSFVDFAQPFRMPDFFLLSGLFVPRVIKRSWRAYADTKILHFLYFYALWGALKMVNLHWRELAGPHPLEHVADYFYIFIEPPTGPLWFIYELALFFVVVKLVRRVPVPLVLTIAVLLQVAVTWGDIEWSIKIADKFARYFVFFYSGYILSPWIFRLTAWLYARSALAAFIVVSWICANQAMVSLHLTNRPGMQLLLGFAGAFGVQLVATLVARVSSAQWVAYLGRHSIVVYLGFVIPLGTMRRLVDQPHTAIDLGTLSFMVMVLSIMGAVLLYWTLRRTPLRFLYDRPLWISIQPRGCLALRQHPAP